ncbi:MAG: PD-(D/E)XK nuclease family protein [Pseudomonadota bacterium]
MPRQRHFMGWDRPVVEAAGEVLTRGRCLRPLDLTEILLVVPTAHSGRRLREHLAVLTGARGGAVLPGPILTPAQLLATDRPLASRLATWVAWTRVLRDLDHGAAPALLPHGPGDDFSGALSTARRLAAVCDALGEAGLAPRDVLDSHGGLEEPQRWEDLAVLHEAVLAQLAARGLADRNRARRQALAALEVPPGVTRVVVLGVTDPMPLAIQALERLAARVPVDVHVHAPESLRDAFDPWGRPRPEVWEAQVLPVRDADIHVAAKPVDQAATAGALLDRLGVPVEDLVIGMPDPDLAPALSRVLEERGAAAYDPGGRPLAGHRISGLVAALGALLRQGSAEAFARLLRHPDFLAGLRTDGHDAAAALEALDAVRMERLPETFERLVEVASGVGEGALVAACDRAARAMEAMRSGPLPEALRGLLDGLYAGAEEETDGLTARAFRDGVTAVRELLDDLEAVGVGDVGMEPRETAALLAAALEGRQVRAAERPPHSVDLVGWLELQWDDAPTLILTGMNDGLVPETVTGDAFLPDSARVRLGLPSNRDRFARDAYLLHAMHAWRATRGGLHLVVGRTDGRGDPLRPSRLLFLCDDDALPPRTERLFAEVEEQGALVPRCFGAPLRPRRVPPPTRLRVTSFRDYLTCPFRFYLRHVLGMGEVDDRKREMDAMDFGTLCHAALEAFGRGEDIRDSDDPGRIATFLCARADAWVRRRYGRNLSAPLQVQLDAARQRLAWAAEVQAAERRAGWRILEVEHVPGGEAGVAVAGMSVRGRVDRIDRHADGRIRVLDYKTGDHARTPMEVHLGGPREDDPPWVEAATVGRPKRWEDLQLPLYALFLEDRFGSGIEVGYFHLPRAVRDTAVVTWPGLSGDLLASALRCAEGVVEAIRRGIFWPPRSVKYDDFEGILLGAPEEVVDAAWMEAMRLERETPP